jgi:hypothetical protein
MRADMELERETDQILVDNLIQCIHLEDQYYVLHYSLGKGFK